MLANPAMLLSNSGMEEAMAGEYERALKNAKRSKRPSRRTYELLRVVADNGDPRAIYAIATWYLHGHEFTGTNFKKAAQMLRKAADAGIAEAAYDLAVSCEKGLGVKKSEKTAFRLYVRAALLGDAQSHYEVGRMYFWGLGTQRDRKIARDWFQKAESLGITG
ncbi:MAG: hypothetical protein U0942_10325 [Parvibaculum sp.]|uniref:tetratricopeptide repeat protein n=1 Tax=Parvibaculum sp. TaxID=2024848 RepID=UPI002ABB67B6|nr:hypothetical protein [Parvibaculum sp.]MDZ4381724.1 hypothetical protein [Parvibaculum sp.]